MVAFLLVLGLVSAFGWNQWNHQPQGLLAGVPYLLDIVTGKGWGFVGLFLLLLNGWLGSLVVATNLLPGVVTLHFLLSFLCLFAYMVSVHKAVPFRFQGLSILSSRQWFWLWLSVFFVVIIGAWSREQVDALRLGDQLFVDGDTTGFLGWGMLNVFAMDACIIRAVVEGIVLSFNALLIPPGIVTGKQIGRAHV